MNDHTKTFLTVAVVFSFLFMLLLKLLKEWKMRQLIQCLQKKDIVRFNKIVYSKIIKFLFPPYNIEYLKLNSALLENNKKEINKQFEKMFKYRLSHMQKKDLLMKAFNYYITIGDDKHAKKVLNIIMQTDDDDLKKETEMLYKILFENSSEYIDAMLKTLCDASEQDRPFVEYLLYHQYKNMNDKENSSLYKEKYMQHAKELNIIF